MNYNGVALIFIKGNIIIIVIIKQLDEMLNIKITELNNCLCNFSFLKLSLKCVKP